MRALLFLPFMVLVSASVAKSETLGDPKKRAECTKELRANPENPSPESRPGQVFINECIARSSTQNKSSSRGVQSSTEVDLLRAQIRSHWVSTPGLPSITVQLRLNQDGTIVMPPWVLTTGTGQSFIDARDKAMTAIFKSQPYKMFKQENYESWKELKITLGGDNKITVKMALAPSETIEAKASQSKMAAKLKSARIGVSCNQERYPTFAAGNQTVISLSIILDRAVAFELLTHEKTMFDVLEFVKNEGRKACEKEKREGKVSGALTNIYTVGVHECDTCNWTFGAELTNEKSGWKIANNSYAIANKQEIEKQQRVQESLTLRQNFSSRFGVQKYVYASDLKANPFIYKGSVVGLSANFFQMLSESEALFMYIGSPILVTKVPTALFKERDETVVLAVKVLGTKAVKVGMGETTVPFGEFVGVYQCGNRCGEFWR